jgi:hypothetical protein
MAAEVWRVVEYQYRNSTRKLVDTDEEQALLEAMIDSVKPRTPRGLGPLHYLLSTPFRHPPLRNGSRFGTKSERALFYAARTVKTALTEVAYYRLVFLRGTKADLGVIDQQLTAFKVPIRAKVAIDLTSPPFSRFRGKISSPVSYADSHALGREMRADGVEAISFFSARDPKGINFALFEPAFGSNKPVAEEGWYCRASTAGVEMIRFSALTPQTHLFPRAHFEVDGKLPTPAT